MPNAASRPTNRNTSPRPPPTRNRYSFHATGRRPGRMRPPSDFAVLRLASPRSGAAALSASANRSNPAHARAKQTAPAARQKPTCGLQTPAPNPVVKISPSRCGTPNSATRSAPCSLIATAHPAGPTAATSTSPRNPTTGGRAKYSTSDAPVQNAAVALRRQNTLHNNPRFATSTRYAARQTNAAVICPINTPPSVIANSTNGTCTPNKSRAATSREVLLPSMIAARPTFAMRNRPSVPSSFSSVTAVANRLTPARLIKTTFSQQMFSKNASPGAPRLSDVAAATSRATSMNPANPKRRRCPRNPLASVLRARSNRAREPESMILCCQASGGRQPSVSRTRE